MADLRFDGRVAVVTGGGRGLGRSYAMLLASRGAKVVVNDPGGSLNGEGVNPGPAESVVSGITGAGGQAVACTESVITPEGGDAYLRDLPDAEIHRLDGGHFAVEDHVEEIATGMTRFYRDKVAGH